MRAVRIHGAKDVRLEEIQEPECTPGTVKIRPAFNGLCGSDLHAYFDGSVFWPNHPLTHETPPVGFGHEFSGTVTSVHPSVPTFSIGDRVAVNPLLHCETCEPCHKGTPNCCPKFGFVGLHGGGGGMSEAIVVRAGSVYELPENVSLEVGALVEPLAVGWHAVGLTRELTEKSVALVLGGGPVGCAVLLALKAKGIRKVVVSEPSKARADIARKLGVSDVWNPMETTIEDQITEMTNGRGPDVVYECSGVAAAFETACKAVARRGQIVNLSVWAEAVPFKPHALMFNEVSFLPVLAYSQDDFRAVIDALAQGKIDPSPMITKRIPMSKLVEEGLEPLHNPKAGHCKILVDLAM